MSSIKVFIDTSALPRNLDNFGSVFERLIDLAQKGVIEIYLSYVVVREWKSHFQEDFAKKISKAQSNISNFLKHKWADQVEGYVSIKECEKNLKISKTSIEEIVNMNVDSVLAEMKAQILPVNEIQAERIIENYFEGGPPFKQPKNRNDFPDAFIYQCAIKLVEDLATEICCVSNDKNLNEALNKIDKIIIFDSISNFIKSEKIHQIIQELDIEAEWKAYIEKVKPQLKLLSGKIEDLLEYKIGDKFNYMEIYDGEFPSDNCDALITGVYQPINIDFGWDELEDIGPGRLLLPVEFDCFANVEMFVYHMDAYSVPEGVRVSMGDHEKESFFEAYADIKIHVEGNLTLHLNLDDFEDYDIEDIFEDVSFEEINSIHTIQSETGSIFV